MKKYTIFYKEEENYYPVYKGANKYWLGGSRVEWLLFKTKAEAEREAKQARKQKSPFFEKGTIVVEMCMLKPR